MPKNIGYANGPGDKKKKSDKEIRSLFEGKKAKRNITPTKSVTSNRRKAFNKAKQNVESRMAAGTGTRPITRTIDPVNGSISGGRRTADSPHSFRNRYRSEDNKQIPKSQRK